MITDDVLPDIPFTFQERPSPISPDLRIGWRVGILLLFLMDCCRGEKASVGQLHVFNWAILSRRSRSILQKIISGDLLPEMAIVRVEPSLNRAIDYAFGESFVEIEKKDGKLKSDIRLTQKGKHLAVAIKNDKDIFKEEKAFMDAIGKGLTKILVTKIFQG